MSPASWLVYRLLACLLACLPAYTCLCSVECKFLGISCFLVCVCVVAAAGVAVVVVVVVVVVAVVVVAVVAVVAVVISSCLLFLFGSNCSNKNKNGSNCYRHQFLLFLFGKIVAWYVSTVTVIRLRSV